MFCGSIFQTLFALTVANSNVLRGTKRQKKDVKKHRWDSAMWNVCRNKLEKAEKGHSQVCDIRHNSE